jgi:hypothetical protein
VGPHSPGPQRLLDGSSGNVEEADIVRVEIDKGVFDAVDVPGDGMEVLAEASEELADR